MSLDTARYEARQRVRTTLALAALLGVFALLVISIYPSIAASSAEINAFLASLPESFRAGFGAESYATVEGFLATELYQFVWILLLGLYMAYSAGGTIASDIESTRLHLVLATPVSRPRVLAEKTLALLTPIVVLSLVMPLVVFGATVAIGYPVDPSRLVALHLLSIPYLLVCTAIGLALSVTFSRGNTAQLGGIATVFLLFMLDSVTAGTDVDWLGAISPSRYVDPTEILLHGTFAVGDAVVLLGVALLLGFVSVVRFQTRDV